MREIGSHDRKYYYKEREIDYNTICEMQYQAGP